MYDICTLVTEAVFMPRMSRVCGGHVGGEAKPVLRITDDRRAAIIPETGIDGTDAIELEWELGSAECASFAYDGWVPFVVAGDFTWIAVAVPVTFAFYGLVRKQIAVDSLTGLSIETLLLFVPSLGYLLWREAKGGGQFGLDWHTDGLLALGEDQRGPGPCARIGRARDLGVP